MNNLPILHMRALVNRNKLLISPVPDGTKIPTRVQDLRVWRKLAPLDPVKGHGRRAGMTRQSPPDRLDPVVDVVPPAVVDVSVLVQQGRVVSAGVQGLADGAEAVQVVEDAEADHVVVLVFLEGDVLWHVRQFLCYGAVNADPVASLIFPP